MGFRVLGLTLLLLLGLQISGAACAAPPPPTPAWSDFRARFIQPDGRVVDTGNGGISHSEGQGFAMVLAVANGDRPTFDRLWTWTNRNLARSDTRLFAWRFDPRAAVPVADPNNATDGDLMIAWALQRAGARWASPGYTRASAEIRKAILAKLAVRQGGRTLLAPGLQGFVQADSLTVNPSYVVLPALDAFAAAEPRSAWPLIRDEGLRLVRDARFGPYNLPPDWARVDATGALWTEPTRPPRFGFDAIRTPLYLCWSGRCSDRAVDGVRRWWAQARANGRRAPAWVDVRSGAVASFPASAGAEAVALLTLGNRTLPPELKGEDYYAAALLALAEVAMREGRARRPYSSPLAR